MNGWVKKWRRTSNKGSFLFDWTLKIKSSLNAYALVWYFLMSHVLTSNSQKIKQAIHDVLKQCSFGIKVLARNRKSVSNDTQHFVWARRGIPQGLTFRWWSKGPGFGNPAQTPHSTLLPPHWWSWRSLSLLLCLSAAGKGWLNRYARNTSAYSCITLQNDFSFFILWSNEDYVNRTGRISLGEYAVWKAVHALFPLHVFHSCAFSVSLLRPSNPYQWKPAWPK